MQITNGFTIPTVDNPIRTIQTYFLIIIVYCVHNIYSYWIKCKSIGLSLIVPLVTLGCFIVKITLAIYILANGIYSMEFAILGFLNIFHFVHVLSIQKYMLIWINSNKHTGKDHIPSFYNFIKMYIGSYFKIWICLHLVGCIIISYLRRYIINPIDDLLARSYSDRLVFHFSIFAIVDIVMCCSIYMFGIVEKKYFKPILQNALREHNMMDQCRKHLKLLALFEISIIISCYVTLYMCPDLINFLNYYNQLYNVNIVEMIAIFTFYTLLVLCYVNIKNNFGSFIIMETFSNSFITNTRMNNLSSYNCNMRLATLTDSEQSNTNTFGDTSCLNASNNLSHTTFDLINSNEIANDLDLKDQKIINDLECGAIKPYNLEIILDSYEKAIELRRIYMLQRFNCQNIKNIPYKNYTYDIVNQQCCENVIGYATIPLGLAGPCVVNNTNFWIPLATTEGCLVASINRGFAAIRRCGGITASIIDDGMTRSPVLQSTSLQDCVQLKNWLKKPVNFQHISAVFESTSRYAKLCSIGSTITGKMIYLRFKATTGNAMGMNMISKAVELSVNYIINVFPSFELISLSGNHCSDKKSAAINWICGRGKTVTAEAIIQPNIVKNILKVDNIDKLIELSNKKIYIGSALAGSIGGFNAHASNSVAAIFAATGQDLGQVVESSNCLTVLDKNSDGSLYISCTMPSLEVGTIGGGTILPTQSACLQIMNVHQSEMGSSSECLAMLICATVLSGELSLLASLCEGTLVKSHLKHNRSQVNIPELSAKMVTTNQSLKSHNMNEGNNVKNSKEQHSLPHHKTCPML